MQIIPFRLEMSDEQLNNDDFGLLPNQRLPKLCYL